MGKVETSISLEVKPGSSPPSPETVKAFREFCLSLHEVFFPKPKKAKKEPSR